MVTPNGRTMTTTSISADRNMAILLILVLNGKIHPEKRHSKKNSLMPDSKETYLSKAVMRLRNIGEEIQSKHKMKKLTILKAILT